jgi:hypothetical protein
MPTSWLFARIALPFPLAGGILGILPVVAGGQIPMPYQFWAVLTFSGGTTLGLAAMVGLLIAREPRARRLTLLGALSAVILLVATYAIAAGSE